MATIRIQGTDLEYQDKDVINFDEGLIGMPHLRRMVLINYSEIDPFFLLCSLDDQQVNFLVLNACSHFNDYSPELTGEQRIQLGLSENETPLFFVTATIAPEWTKSTMNMKAPIVVGPTSMKAAQVILNDSRYSMTQPLPPAWVVAAA